MERAKKTLTREQYLKKFSRAARWRLPPQESEEAIADYRELIFREERDESKLVEELGEPVQAAHLLTDVKTYRRWLKIFAVLAFGLFLLAWWSWTGIPFIHFSSWDWGMFGEGWRGIAVLAVGLALSLYWFRRHGQKNGPLSKRLVLALAVVLIAGCRVMYGIWDVTGALIYEQVSVNTWQYRQQVYLVITAMMYVGTLSALAAFAGLVLAKCYDRRWLALYILGVTVAAMIGFVTFNFKGINLDYPTADMIRSYLFARLIPIGAVGLIGTGVALC